MIIGTFLIVCIILDMFHKKSLEWAIVYLFAALSELVVFDPLLLALIGFCKDYY